MTLIRRTATALAGIPASAARAARRQPATAVAAGPAWDAWRAGDFSLARATASDGIASGRDADGMRHVLVLAATVVGDYDEAIASYELIDARYRHLPDLDEPILWAHVHRDDVARALSFAEGRGLARRSVVARRLRLAMDRPLRIDGAGVVDVPFTDDALTPVMPGFEVRLNGRQAVARLDTGGSFIHLSSKAAATHGIETIASERSFASLTWHTVRHGVADLDIGSIHLENVPVTVHDGGLTSEPIADAFGVELGPIIGTNVLERFLTTVDASSRQLTLSVRGDADARSAHLARLGSPQQEAHFALWSDHLMIARGRIGGLENANLFVDSGLVVFTAEQGQAAVMASRGALASWNVDPPENGGFAELPGDVAIGAVARDRMTAYVVPDSTWRDLGDWGGIRVDALVSWGFLRHYSWTIDFDRMRYLFGEAASD